MSIQKDNTNHTGSRLGKLMIIGTWIIVLFMLTLFFDAQIAQMFNPNSAPSATETDNGTRQVVLQRNRSGHYIVSGFINNQPVQFMVDTGATDVAIPAALADKLKLEHGNRIIYSTANGNVQGYTTRLDTVTIGNITLNNIRGGINPGMSEQVVLLGMSFLKQLEFTQRNQTLILKHLP